MKFYLEVYNKRINVSSLLIAFFAKINMVFNIKELK